jgi:cytoskeletal protein CcmA (bactofilin family)
MLNKGSLFAGKREQTTLTPSDIRPINTSTTAPSPTVAPNVTPLPGKDEAATPVEARPPTPRQEETPQGAKLIVGPGVKLKGAEIQDCDTLVVEGRVEATMDSRFIQIADKGSFDGKVNIDVAEIHGRFAGELTAREQLVIYATGHVSGKIRYGKIVIHEGGELSGDVKSLTAGETTAVGTAGDFGISKLLAANSA